MFKKLSALKFDFKKMSIRKKLTLSAWIIAIVPMVLMFLAISIYFYRSNVQSAQEQAQLALDKSVGELDTWISQASERNVSIATDLNIQNAIGNYANADYKEKLEIRDFIRNRLLNSYTSDMCVKNISVYLRENKKTFSSDYTDWDLYQALGQEIWFNNLLEKTDTYWLGWGKSVSTNTPVLQLASAISSNITGEVLGISYTELDPKKINLIFEPMMQNGLSVAQKEKNIIVGNPHTPHYISVFTQSEIIDLDVEYRLATESFSHAFRIALQLLTVGLLILMFVLYLLCKYFSEWFAQRIIVMRNATAEIAQGNLGLTVTDTHQDELGELAGSLNKMSAQIKHLIEENYLSEIENQQARLQALQSQINPHFIYNTLESISMLALLHDNYEIVDMAQAFSGMMRYAMQSEPEVTVQQELENVKSYLAIQNIRFPSGFTVDFFVDPACTALCILRLSLQPLVENAFIHGFKNMPACRTLRITVRTRRQHLLLYVFNDGEIIEAKRMKRIHSLLQETKEDPMDCFALRNLSRRLKLTYGNTARLDIRCVYSGTLAVIRIPMTMVFLDKETANETNCDL